MSKRFILLFLFSVLSITYLQAQNQTGQKWSTGGNSSVSGDFVGTINNEPLVFKTNAKPRFTIDANGNFEMNSFSGIGKGLLSYDNNGKVLPFTFNGNSNAFLNGDGSFTSVSSIIGLTGWKLDPANGNVFQTSSGYVGIGTTDPQLKLHVAGDALVEGYVFTQGISIIGRAWGQKMYSDTIDVKLIEMDSLKRISGETRIDGKASVSQKLGIGTKYPEAELDVKGNMALSGEAKVNSIKIPNLANPEKQLLFADGNGVIKSLGGMDLGVFLGPHLNDIIRFHPIRACGTPDEGTYWNTEGYNLYTNPIECSKVGIGTRTPTANLDVPGSSLFGSYIANSGLIRNRLIIGNESLDYDNAAKLDVIGENQWTSNGWKKAIRIGHGNAFEFAGDVGTERNWGMGNSNGKWYMFFTNTEDNSQAANYVMTADGYTVNIEGALTVKGVEQWVTNTTQNSISNNSAGVVIGDTHLPTDYKFAVNGKAIATTLDVAIRDEWPDYVFEKDYKLKDLYEVDSFIQKNKHLPEMKSAKEMKSIDIGETQTNQQKKIEELFLYVIELKKENDKLNTELNSIKKQLNTK